MKAIKTDKIIHVNFSLYSPINQNDKGTHLNINNGFIIECLVRSWTSHVVLDLGCIFRFLTTLLQCKNRNVLLKTSWTEKFQFNLLNSYKHLKNYFQLKLPKSKKVRLSPRIRRPYKKGVYLDLFHRICVPEKPLRELVTSNSLKSFIRKNQT